MVIRRRTPAVPPRTLITFFAVVVAYDAYRLLFPDRPHPLPPLDVHRCLTAELTPLTPVSMRVDDEPWDASSWIGAEDHAVVTVAPVVSEILMPQ